MYSTEQQSGIAIYREFVATATDGVVLHNVTIRDSHIQAAVVTATDGVELHSVTITDIHIHRLEVQG